MAVSETIKQCFKCKQNIKLEKVGEKDDGKPIWKLYETDGVSEHQCKKPTTSNSNSGINNKKSVELLESVNSKLGEILAELRRQGMR